MVVGTVACRIVQAGIQASGSVSGERSSIAAALDSTWALAAQVLARRACSVVSQWSCLRGFNLAREAVSWLSDRCKIVLVCATKFTTH